MEDATTLTLAKKKRKRREIGGVSGTAPIIPAPHDGVSHTLELLGKLSETRDQIDYIVIRPKESIDDGIYCHLTDGGVLEMPGNQYEVEPVPGLKFSFLDDGIAIIRHTQRRFRSPNAQFDNWFKELHEGIDALALVATALNEGHDFKGKTGATTAAAGLADILRNTPTYSPPMAKLLPRKEILFFLDFIDFLLSNCSAQRQMFSDIGQASRQCRAMVET